MYILENGDIHMFKELKLLVVDVDGSLTDGMYNVMDNGHLFKSFYTRDFYGLEQLLINGIDVYIVSQSDDYIIKEQIERICRCSESWSKFNKACNIMVHTGVKNKRNFIETICRSNKIPIEGICYFGDAENDIECIKSIKISGCPADAILDVKKSSYFTSNHNGGKGAVYDFCRYILENINKEKK